MENQTPPRPALLGGIPAVTLSPSIWPVIERADVELVASVIESGKWSWVGPQERAFCTEYAKFIGTRYCLGLANGTVTMQCALQAVGVVPGDEVIVPGLTWVATAQAAMDVGANVVFADIDPLTLVLDPASYEAAITPKTKAIMPVHLYGCMCDMDAIMEISRKHGIKVVEDVAHQQGSRWRDLGAGGIGDAGSYSFQQSKVITCGEGGAVTCNDTDVYRTVFALKQVGWAPADPENAPFDSLIEAQKYGHNYRMTEVQAALLRGGLRRLPQQTQDREESALRLREGLAELDGPLQVAPRDPRITTQAYYALTLVFDPAKADGLTREQYLAALSAEGCSMGATYGPVYRHGLLNLYDSTSPIPFRDPATMQDYKSLQLPNTEKACAETAVTMGHRALLGSPAYIDQLLAAVRRANDSLPALRRHFQEAE